MLTIRKAAERGHANHGWLDTHHTFSFADYYDPKHMGFGPLRVINDDTVAGGGGFPPHPHRDMEIISYVIEGALAHEDSMGNGSVIKPGDVQRMSAGRGVVHSEFNASPAEPVHFLQIWILPKGPGLPSGYEQKFFSDEDKRGKLRLVASSDGAEGSVRIQQDARLYASILEAGDEVSHTIPAQRKGWLHVVTGEAMVNGRMLEAGDGVAIDGEERLSISSATKGEVLLFDMKP
ncbi:MAG TPA: pirin family protein [Polyangia bacterium]|jgi:redox-sensitive bicupin YhaK (pirin superfamily)|nr:pirin family protein [Polyangia bacterium]